MGLMKCEGKCIPQSRDFDSELHLGLERPRSSDDFADHLSKRRESQISFDEVREAAIKDTLGLHHVVEVRLSATNGTPALGKLERFKRSLVGSATE
jgi:hypothetical protein